MTRFYFFLTLLSLVTLPIKTLAHGASIDYHQTPAIKIQAKYDDGTPMANAQVVIYAPSDRATPWLKGTTDDAGNFAFVPDTTSQNIGDWDVKVRQAGHGNITSIPVTAAKTASSQTQLLSAGAGYSPSQKLIMAMATGWGFIGTALFFARSKSDK